MMVFIVLKVSFDVDFLPFETSFRFNFHLFLAKPIFFGVNVPFRSFPKPFFHFHVILCCSIVDIASNRGVCVS